jgi:6-hydroxycyclohex-1-ene-1-carbonyl-CoA dehydrogenase
VKAAVFRGAGQPLAIEDVPRPAPASGEVLIRVAACGVCHTDLHYIDHGTPTFTTPPLVLGHEISGRIEATGAAVAGFAEGDPVLAAAVLSCGSCRACRAGRENICENGVMLGNHVDGGYAEYVAVPARDLFSLPPEVPLVEGAIIADAVTTPFHAVVNRGRVQPGDHVLVLGCGGVGLNVVQVAAALGARVIAADLSDDKLGWAARLGATDLLNPSRIARLDREVRRITGGGGVDVAFEVVGRGATQEQAFACLRTGGRLVLVGYSPDAMTLNSGRVMFRELDVIGSLGCRPLDYPRVIELVRQQRIRVRELVTHRFPLERINEALDVLRAGAAVRAVVTPD